MSENDNTLKICRQCHTIYHSLNQKFCGNGCDHNPPYFKNNKFIKNLETREVLIPKAPKEKIKWICLQCYREYLWKDIQDLDFVCKCGFKNDFYPFTTKACANDSCKLDGIYHKLPLNAKVCDTCGKSNFILNLPINPKKVEELVPQERSDIQLGISLSDFKEQATMKEQAKDKLSLTFRVLNNNYQQVLFGENMSLSIETFIRKSPGYVPYNIFLNLLESFGLEEELFQIKFLESSQEYVFSSILDFEGTKLNARHDKIGNFQPIQANTTIKFKENEIWFLKHNYFKIQISVY